MAKPKVTPYQLDIWSSNMAELYNSLEGEIIRIIIKRLNRGHDDILQWQAEKLQELRLFNSDVTRLLSEVIKVAESEIKRMLEDTGVRIIKDVDNAMPYDIKSIPNNIDQVMRGYYNTELAQKGIDSVLVDSRGRRWNIEGYVRNLLKSTLGNTYDEVRKERMADYDVHTVVVTSHAGAREACSRIQGNVVDLRRPEELPHDWPYKSIYDPYWQAEYGTPGGHRGINCRHLHIPFIPSVNTNNQSKFDSELNKRVAKARDKQRRIEREIVKYKKNHMVAKELGSDKADYWKMMVGRRQKAMREHLKENGDYLSRNYKREKVYIPLDTLLKDFSYRD